MASRLFAVDLDLNLNKARQFVFEDFLTDPTSATGRTYYNTTGNRLKVYNGTAWKSLAYTDDSFANTTYAISAESVSGGANLRLTGSDAVTDDVKIASGTNVTVTRTDANTITISSTDTDTNTTYDLNAGGTTSPTISLVGTDSTTDTVTFAAGTGISLGQATGTITITNTVSDTNTTYDLTSTGTTTASINLVPSSGGTDSVTITGSGATSISHTAGAITVSSTDTDTNYYPSAIVFGAGTTAGPTLDLTMSGSGAPDLTAVAIPSASGTASGVVTTNAQTFAGEKTFSSNVIISGNLTVDGDTTTLNVSSLLVEDNIVILNKNVTGTPSLNAGIEVERGDSTNASITWNETSEFWTAGLTGSEMPIARKYAETISTTGGSAYTVTHGIGSTDVIVQTYVGNSLVECDIDITSGTAITVTTNANTANIRVVVVG